MNIKTTILACIAPLVFTNIVHGALTLTVNTINQTLTWSGTATSTAIPLPEFQNSFITLGTKATTNVNGRVPGTVESQPGLGVSISQSFGAGDGFINADQPGQIYVNETTGNEFVAAFVANYFLFAAGHTATITLTGNDTPYLYVVPGNPNSSLEQSQIDFLATLDGTEIHFRTNNPNFVNDTYGSAGTINVILVPEPSTISLGGLGLLALIARRKRG